MQRFASIALVALIGCEGEVDVLEGELSHPADIDFGEVALGVGALRRVELENSSNETITFRRFDSTNPRFRIERPPSALRAGSTISFDVYFEPIGEGEERGRIELESTGGLRLIEVVGRGLFPLAIDPGAIDFGTVEGGALVERELVIRNLFPHEVSFEANLDPPFQSDPPVLGGSIGAGGVARYRIKYVGARAEKTGDLTIRACDTSACVRSVPISAKARTGVFCDPMLLVIDAAIGETKESVATCRNETDRIVTVNGATLAPPLPGLTIHVQPASLDPGESISIGLSFAPQIPQAGLAASGLIRLDADPSSQLDYLVSVVPSDCRISTPSLIELGASPIPTIVSRPLSITNLGSDPCVIEGLSAADPFRVKDGVSALMLEPGESRLLWIEYIPSSEGAQTGQLELSTSDPSRAEVSIPLSGVGLASGLLVYPRVVRFGDVEVGCAGTAHTTAYLPSGALGVGSAELSLSTDSSSAFSLTTTSSLTIPGEAQIEVRFAPASPGIHFGTLIVTEAGGAQHLVTLAGESEDGTFEERIEHLSSSVDILFVVDDTTSPVEERQLLSQSFDVLVSPLLDYQVGVVSTTSDICFSTPSLYGNCGSLSEGNEMTSMPEWRIITPDEVPSPAVVFSNTTLLGVNGSANEQGLEGARLALAHPKVFGWNQGFLRRNANLAVVYLSDEEDQSPQTISYYRDWLYALKGFDERARVAASAIAGDVPSGCYGPGGNAGAGARYIALAESTSGVFASICASDWQQSLSPIHDVVSGLRRRLYLAARPVASTITVSENGAPVRFVYDSPSNSVEVQFGAALADADYVIAYETACE